MITLNAHNADRWMTCRKSAHLDRERADEMSDSAKEGICAAWVAETIIEGDATCAEDLVGKVHLDWEVTPDMARHIDPYVEMILSRKDPRAEIERTVESTVIRMSSRLDAESWLDDGTLCIDDLKYGFRVVEPTTWQLAVELAMRYFLDLPVPDKIQLGIYQPRAVHHLGIYRTTTLTRDQAIANASLINNRAVEIAEGDDTATPGPHCAGCAGAAECDALTQSVYAMWAPVEKRTHTVPTNQQLADELEMLDAMGKMMKARRAAVEAEVEGRMRQQQVVPGWAKMPIQGKRMFTVDADTIRTMTGIDPTDRELVTPAELERRGAKKSIVDMITKKPNVGHKLTRVDERAIAKMFESGKRR